MTLAEFTNTIRVAREFEAGKGKKLQELLEARAKTTDSWLSDWWLDGAYLSYRDPVVVFSSPGLIFPEQRFKNETERLTYAVKVVSASLNYKAAIDNNQIPVEKVGKAELDMQQYHKIFGTCRIPGVEKDSLIYNPQSDYIVVMNKGNVSIDFLILTCSVLFSVLTVIDFLVLQSSRLRRLEWEDNPE